MADARAAFLLCRVQQRLCAFPVASALEIMRPQPVDPLPNVPRFVLGIALIRGEATPIVDAGTLLAGTATESPSRFVTLRAGTRRVGVAVDDVVGVRSFPASTLNDMHPLTADASAHAVSAVGRLDHELLSVLESARIIPGQVWTAVDEANA